MQWRARCSSKWGRRRKRLRVDSRMCRTSPKRMWFLTRAMICSVSSLEKRRRREDCFGDADADFDVAVEADAIVRVVGVGWAEGGGLADVVKERSPGEGGEASGREFFEEEHGVDPDVAFGVELGRLLDAVHALLASGRTCCEEAGGVEEFEGAAGVGLR